MMISFRAIIFTSFLLCGTCGLWAQTQAKRAPEDKDMAVYLMVYFKDESHSLYFALSPDGYTFTDVNNGSPVIAGDTIASQRGVRDPS